MKKSNILTIILALVAIAALVFGFVTNGQKADLQKQVDDLKANITTLNTSLDAAKQEAADAVKSAEGLNADLQKQVEDLQANLEAAKQEAADAVKNAEDEIAKVKEEAEKAIEEAKTALTAPVEEAPAAPAEEEAPAATVEEAPAATVMSHADYVAAELETEVTIEAYVQAKQSWWDNKATLYLQAEDGAYFVYNMTISEEDYAKLVPGTKVRVTGYKAEWSGEVEITDATFEILEAEAWIAEPADVTELLASEELIAHQNELVAVKGVTVEAYDESGAAFAYKNAENKTDDLYFKVSKDGQTYEFCVEFYLCGQDTDVYKAVEALNVGDVINLEGFLYWYNGANLQATALTK